VNKFIFALFLLLPAAASAASTGTASAVDQAAPPSGGAITLFGNPAVVKSGEGPGRAVPAETGGAGEKKNAKNKKPLQAGKKPEDKGTAAGDGSVKPEKKKLVPVTHNSQLPFRKSCDDCPCKWALGQIFDIVGGSGAPPAMSSGPVNAFKTIVSTEMPRSLRMGQMKRKPD